MRLELFQRYPELQPEGLVRLVNFAKLTRGFRELPNADQVILLKSSCIDLIVCALLRVNLCILSFITETWTNAFADTASGEQVAARDLDSGAFRIAQLASRSSRCRLGTAGAVPFGHAGPVPNWRGSRAHVWRRRARRGAADAAARAGLARTRTSVHRLPPVTRCSFYELC